ncbi:response regulator [Myxococcota bacterium]|nr:response regulator [Myxococcota bacterium]
MSPVPRVLHVDDDPAIREVVRLMLEGIGGMEVDSVEGGPAALARASQQRPDVVLLDVMMPGMDGPQTLRELRTLEGCADLPVIFLTAKVMRREMGQLQQLGAARIIQKPFRARELVEAVRAAVEELRRAP